MNQLTIIRYTFLPYFDGYFQNGKWHNKNGKELKVKHYNGRNCINSFGKIYGINKLRKFAFKTYILEEILPF